MIPVPLSVRASLINPAHAHMWLNNVGEKIYTTPTSMCHLQLVENSHSLRLIKNGRADVGSLRRRLWPSPFIKSCTEKLV